MTNVNPIMQGKMGAEFVFDQITIVGYFCESMEEYKIWSQCHKKWVS